MRSWGMGEWGLCLSPFSSSCSCTVTPVLVSILCWNMGLNTCKAHLDPSVQASAKEDSSAPSHPSFPLLSSKIFSDRRPSLFRRSLHRNIHTVVVQRAQHHLCGELQNQSTGPGSDKSDLTHKIKAVGALLVPGAFCFPPLKSPSSCLEKPERHLDSLPILF